MGIWDMCFGEKWVGVQEEVEGKGVVRYCVNRCSLAGVGGLHNTGRNHEVGGN